MSDEINHDFYAEKIKAEMAATEAAKSNIPKVEVEAEKDTEIKKVSTIENKSQDLADLTQNFCVLIGGPKDVAEAMSWVEQRAKARKKNSKNLHNKKI